MFGENLTTSGLEVDEARLGELWRVGTALLEVTERPGHELTVTTFFRAATGDKELAASIIEAGVLRPIERDWLQSRL